MNFFFIHLKDDIRIQNKTPKTNYDDNEMKWVCLYKNIHIDVNTLSLLRDELKRCQNSCKDPPLMAYMVNPKTKIFIEQTTNVVKPDYNVCIGAY